MQNCLFCKIISQTIPAPRVYEDDLAIVIRDINPQAPTHLLVMPKKHYSGIHEVSDSDSLLFEGLLIAVKNVVQQEKLGEQGYRLIVNYGESAGQTVPHIHIHLLSGRPMHWPPG